MQQKLILLIARGLFIVGIAIFAMGVFLESVDVATLSTYKAEKTFLENEYEEKYKLKKPEAPVDFSILLPEPIKPAEDAPQDEKTKYDQEFKEYEDLKKQEEEKFEEAQKEYEKLKVQYEYNKKLNEYYKKKEEKQINAQKEEFDKKITLQGIVINIISGKQALRFIGTLILLLGAGAILVLGENWERVGVIVFMGFAFRTLVGF